MNSKNRIVDCKGRAWNVICAPGEDVEHHLIVFPWGDVAMAERNKWNRLVPIPLELEASQIPTAMKAFAVTLA